MAEAGASETTMNRPNFLCPEILQPGQTGCKFNELTDRLARVEEASVSHTNTLIRLEAYGEASTKWAKACAALISILIAICTLYFASLEARLHAGVVTSPKIGTLQSYKERHPIETVVSGYISQR